MPNRSIDTSLSTAHRFIENAIEDPEILAAFTAARRDLAYFEAGRALYQRALDLTRGQNNAYADQDGVSSELKTARKKANASYLEHLEWARFAFEDDDRISNRLQLRGRRNETVDGWEQQVSGFYAELLGDPALIGALTDLGRSSAELEAGRTAIQEAVRLGRSLLKEVGDAQDTTKERDEALSDLAKWRRKTTKLARLLFADHPQKLEKLGIVVRSTPRRTRPRSATPPTSPPAA